MRVKLSDDVKTEGIKEERKVGMTMQLVGAVRKVYNIM